MIYGERIRLRAVERDDLPRYVAWLNDPEVITGLSINFPMSSVDEESWFENMMKHPVAEHPLAIDARVGDEWKHIGSIGFHQIDNRVHSCELGIVIGDKSCWDQGYGSEAMHLGLKHCFNTLNLNRVFLRVLDNNPRAIHVYEKIGFVHEGRMRQAEYKDGRFIDVFFMSVLRSEWKE